MSPPEKSLTCPECDMGGFTSATLKQHQLLHAETDERAYACDHCDHRMRSKQAKETHERRHLLHAFPCPHCTSNFDSTADLQSHLRFKHNETQDQFVSAMNHRTEVRRANKQAQVNTSTPAPSRVQKKSKLGSILRSTKFTNSLSVQARRVAIQTSNQARSFAAASASATAASLSLTSNPSDVRSSGLSRTSSSNTSKSQTSIGRSVAGPNKEDSYDDNDDDDDNTFECALCNTHYPRNQVHSCKRRPR